MTHNPGPGSRKKELRLKYLKPSYLVCIKTSMGSVGSVKCNAVTAAFTDGEQASNCSWMAWNCLISSSRITALSKFYHRL